RAPPISPLFPYTTLFRSSVPEAEVDDLIAELIGELGRGEVETQRSLSRALASFGPLARYRVQHVAHHAQHALALIDDPDGEDHTDRKSTRLNSSHVSISY